MSNEASCVRSLEDHSQCQTCNGNDECPGSSTCAGGVCKLSVQSCLKTPSAGMIHYSQWPWRVVSYQEGDLDMKGRFDPKSLSKAPEGKTPRVVRYYHFCSDEKVFDDAFCTRFDRGVTATEIVRNYIEAEYRGHFFKNYKRDNASFDGRRDSYFINKWLWTYYMMGKFLSEMTVNQIVYEESWSSYWAALDVIPGGPEGRMMKPGSFPDGGEDLMRGMLLAYQYMVYDVLMRPDVGEYELAVDKSGKSFWTPALGPDDPLDPQPRGKIELGPGWGWADKWDSQADWQSDRADTTIYYDHLIRIGVELDKIIALEVLSIPAALNDRLWHEKANGASFWNSIWTNDGQELWEVMRGLVTEVHNHRSNPWCMAPNGKLTAYPVQMLEGFLDSGIIEGVERPQMDTRCPEGSYPVEPGMDALYAIYPIFWSISGPSHPWYTNALTARLEAQIKGGDHQFDIPEGADWVEFTNPSGTRTWQAVQTEDGMSIAYEMVEMARDMMNRIRFLEACRDEVEPNIGAPGTYDRTCEDLNRYCGYRPEEWCQTEGWSELAGVIDLPDGFKYRDVDRIEALLIMMQDMVTIAGHQAWRTPGVLENP